MPTERDLFEEEQHMVAMSFGDHIEELRTHLIRALLGLAVGVVVTFLPVLNLGTRVLRKMQDPAQEALQRFYEQQAEKRSKQAKEQGARTAPVVAFLDPEQFAEAVRKLYPQLPPPAKQDLAQLEPLPITTTFDQSGMIQVDNQVTEPRNALVSLAPMEGFAIYFFVCLVTGLVLSSPWVFYQFWAFVAAGLYRHEKKYVYRFLPFSLGLFLGGVMLCFFIALPWTLEFLLDFNVWLGIDPTLRISYWMSFATMLPLIFGIGFQTPLVMMLLERVGIFTVEDYRSNWKMAVFVIVVAAAIITPTQDPLSLSLLAGPMIGLYGLGILLVSRNKTARGTAAMAG
jgi:sec-independent protein translocase protein TatC